MGGVKSKLANYNIVSCCCKRQDENNDSYINLPRPPTFTFNGCIDASREGALAVKEIDLCFEKNGEDHHTKKFNLMKKDIDRCLVIRRGQAFMLKILLNRPFDINSDAISFIFHVADVKMRGPSSNTIAAVPLLEKGKESKTWWSAAYESQTDCHLIVSVTPPADCVVAPWTIEIDTKSVEGGSYSYLHPLPIYVLFNTWCKNDVVYMPDESHRQEYVLEDGGIIFRGDGNIVKPAPWHYAQFDKDILDCALFLVREVGKFKGRARGDPISTVRVLSAVVNGNDDGGVLWGNWSNEPHDYDDGTSPLDWIGSLNILQKYYRYKEPVKYAQCWVYAGVLTTICRALGIPCRPVTCYNSAHDSDGSLTIDEIIEYDENGNVTKFGESVWNYHVWNEVWMDRQDIGSDYNGWQIIDSTPQERSENVFRCGPAPLKAVYNGELQIPYDVSFVLAEVNADKVTWKSTGPENPLKFVSRDISSIGQCISTKAVGNTGREDITHLYKDPEGSRKEREMFESALRQSESVYARYYLNEVLSDVEFNVELRDDVIIGQDFAVILQLKNRSASESHHIMGILRVDSVTYRGLMGASVKQQDIDLVLGPEEKSNIRLLVTFEDYYHKLTDQAAFKITCLATIAARNFDHVSRDNFRLRNPDVKVTYDGEAVVGQPLYFNLELKNPLPIPLKKGNFYIQGGGMNNQLTLQVDEEVPSGSAAQAEFQIVPCEAGSYQISVKFSSKELQDVDGFFTIDVADSGYRSILY